MDQNLGSFTWDRHKELINIEKHGVDFTTAAQAFLDPQIKIYRDDKHSQKEPRWFGIGKIGEKILTVRFVYSEGKIRIFGAGYWRKGGVYYGQKD